MNSLYFKGKSTIFKQMKIIHAKGYDPEECARFKEVIYGNILQSIRILIAQAKKMEIQLQNEDIAERAEKIAKIPEQQVIMNPLSTLTQEMGRDISVIWNDQGIREVFARKSEFQLSDSTEYYLNDMTRISNPNYSPTQQDVLRSRVKTVGVVENDFLIDGFKFKMVDVGGNIITLKSLIFD
jgi:hypothetical protein